MFKKLSYWKCDTTWTKPYWAVYVEPINWHLDFLFRILECSNTRSSLLQWFEFLNNWIVQLFELFEHRIIDYLNFSIYSNNRKIQFWHFSNYSNIQTIEYFWALEWFEYSNGRNWWLARPLHCCKLSRSQCTLIESFTRRLHLRFEKQTHTEQMLEFSVKASPFPRNRGVRAELSLSVFAAASLVHGSSSTEFYWRAEFPLINRPWDFHRNKSYVRRWKVRYAWKVTKPSGTFFLRASFGEQGKSARRVWKMTDVFWSQHPFCQFPVFWGT